ncbi:hypothetical protein KKA47_01050 [bacterium]|nr:hypothetical protein [bacterium]
MLLGGIGPGLDPVVFDLSGNPIVFNPLGDLVKTIFRAFDDSFHSTYQTVKPAQGDKTTTSGTRLKLFDSCKL